MAVRPVLALAGFLAAAPQDLVLRPLANGVYAVLHESAVPGRSASAKKSQITLLYDRDCSDSGKKQPPRYVTLDTSSFVPLILNGPPELAGEYRGHPMLRLTLAPDQVKPLEVFTRTNLGGTIAILVDGEIVTMHKVRAVIENGLVQISRCDDAACRVMRMKLTR